MKTRRSFVAGGIVGLAAMPWTAARSAAPPAFVLGTDADETTFYGLWLRRVYAEALRRLDMRLEAAVFPTMRASLMADQGSIDGEMVRAPSYAAAHPDLVRVDEPMFDVAFAIYAAKAMPGANRLEDLVAADTHGVYRRGVAVCENALKPALPADRLSEVTTTAQGLGMLVARRGVFFCELDSSVWNEVSALSARDAAAVQKLFNLGNPVPLYPYLHRKHAELAPRLAAVLKQMKAEGLFDRYRVEVMQKLGRTDERPPTR